MWFTVIGPMTTILVAVITTLIFGSNDLSAIDENLVAPCIRKYLKSTRLTNAENDDEEVIIQSLIVNDESSF